MSPEARILALRLLLDGAYLALSSSPLELREVSGGGYVAYCPDLNDWTWERGKATATLRHVWKLNPGVQDAQAWFLVQEDPKTGKDVVLQSGRLKDDDGKERPCRVLVHGTPVSVSVTVGLRESI